MTELPEIEWCTPDGKVVTNPVTEPDLVKWQEVREFVVGCIEAGIKNPAVLEKLVGTIKLVTAAAIAGKDFYDPMEALRLQAADGTRLRAVLQDVLSSPKYPEPDKQSADAASAAPD
jgi:hypothetical protein